MIWQITKWSENITHYGKDLKMKILHTTDNCPIIFRAYDDDDYLYCTGIADSVSTVDIEVFVVLQADYGVTYIKLYDRKTGKYIDSLG